MRRCFYDILDIDRSSDSSEIKKAYYKQALKYHPDKCGNDEESTKIFQEIQNAYEILSDPQEKQWYDDHREQILRGNDDDSEDVDYVVNVWKYFNSGVYSGYGTDAKSFYNVYDAAFKEIFFEEQLDEAPDFGTKESSISQVLAFYDFWQSFVSTRTFTWCDEYNTTEAPNRQIRRAMERENKKLRDAAKRKYTNDIRILVDFVKKRDKRIIQYQTEQNQLKEARQKQEEEEKKRVIEQYRMDRDAFQQKQDEQWKKIEQERAELSPNHRSIRLADEEEEEAFEKLRKRMETTVLYCEPCKKSFKSEKQLQNHAKSKKHKELAKDLVVEMIPLEEKPVPEPTKPCPISVKKDQKAIESVNSVSEAEAEQQKKVLLRKAKEEAAAARRQKRKQLRKEKNKQPSTTHDCGVCQTSFATRNARKYSINREEERERDSNTTLFSIQAY